MNDITEVDRLNAEIADLKRTIEWYQGRTGIMMGVAARAEIVSAPIWGAGEVPRLIELLNAIKPNFGDVGSRDVEVKAQRERIEEAIAILSAAPTSVPQPAALSQQAQIWRQEAHSHRAAVFVGLSDVEAAATVLADAHPLDGLHINRGSMDAASDAYFHEWQKSKCRTAYENRYHKVAALCPYDEWEACWFKALSAATVPSAK